jgi:RNAse (barnase) inhibitor barstar
MSKLLQRLQDPARSGVYRAARIDEIADAVKDSKLLLLRIPYADKPQLLENMASVLGFPDWFGHNWDALEDCLTDLSWREAPGYVLVMDSAQPGDDLGVLVDILRSAAESWAGRGKPFFAVFIDPQRRLPLPDLFRQS